MGHAFYFSLGESRFTRINFLLALSVCLNSTISASRFIWDNVCDIKTKCHTYWRNIEFGILETIPFACNFVSKLQMLCEKWKAIDSLVLVFESMVYLYWMKLRKSLKFNSFKTVNTL